MSNHIKERKIISVADTLNSQRYIFIHYYFSIFSFPYYLPRPILQLTRIGTEANALDQMSVGRAAIFRLL